MQVWVQAYMYITIILQYKNTSQVQYINCMIIIKLTNYLIYQIKLNNLTSLSTKEEFILASYLTIKS